MAYGEANSNWQVGLIQDTSLTSHLKHAAGQEVGCHNGLAVRPSSSLRRQQSLQRLSQDRDSDFGKKALHEGWVGDSLFT